MGAVAIRLKESFRSTKNTKAPGGRKPQTVFGPSGKGLKPGRINVAGAYSMANKLVNAELAGQKQAALLPARTLKFEGRLNNAAKIQGMLDDLDVQADQLLSGLSTEEE